jgi:hypothetical protein
LDRDVCAIESTEFIHWANVRSVEAPSWSNTHVAKNELQCLGP